MSKNISPTLEVSRSDLKEITDAILDSWVEVYTCGSGREITSCRFCNKEQDYDYEKYKIVNPSHSPDCPVLIAISIAPNE